MNRVRSYPFRSITDPARGRCTSAALARGTVRPGIGDQPQARSPRERITSCSHVALSRTLQLLLVASPLFRERTDRVSVGAVHPSQLGPLLAGWIGMVGLVTARGAPHGPCAARPRGNSTMNARDCGNDQSSVCGPAIGFAESLRLVGDSGATCIRRADE
jgi:hypothetical protein